MPRLLFATCIVLTLTASASAEPVVVLPETDTYEFAPEFEPLERPGIRRGCDIGSPLWQRYARPRAQLVDALVASIEAL